MKTRKPFRFKQFEVKQEMAAMPVTTDACIFGAVIDLKDAEQVIDIGTGTGLLALMLAQRFDKARITGIELDLQSAAEAQGNFDDSPWSNRLACKTGDFREMAFDNRYDVLVCNPPFFRGQLQSNDARKRQARHTVTLDYAQLLEKSLPLLHESSQIWLLIPNLHLQEMLDCAALHSLHLLHNIQIRSFAHSHPHVNILGMGLQQHALQQSTITIYAGQGQYTAEVQTLMQAYYPAIG